MAGGLELGVDLSAENGGVPETAIILVNGPTCPAPLVAIATTIQGLGSLSTCLYAPVGAVTAGGCPARECDTAMRDKIKGAVLGALVAAFATVLLAQTPPWTAPITWTTGDLLTAAQFNAQFRDNLLNLRAFSACAETGITGTASAITVLFGDCRWEDLPSTTVIALDMGRTDTTTASRFKPCLPLPD